MWVLFLFNNVAAWLGEWRFLCHHFRLLPESLPACCRASALAVAMEPAHCGHGASALAGAASVALL